MVTKALIFIPTYNCGQFLERMIDWIDKAMLDYDVCVVDSSSTDRSDAVLKKHVTFFNQISPNDFDHGGTRSLAEKYTQYEIVVFLTQDALPISKADIDRLVSVFENKKIAAAYGRQLPYENASIFGKHLRLFNYPENSKLKSLDDAKNLGIKAAFISNSFSAYRVQTMQKMGWFKSELIMGEDAYIGTKLLLEGFEIAYVANASVMHSHNYTVWEDFKRYFDTGVFHKMEYWILEELGRPEGEGLRYVKSELNYLVQQRKLILLPEFVIRNFCKYMGYKCGLHYNKFPRYFVKRMSMHYRWWEKYWKKG